MAIGSSGRAHDHDLCVIMTATTIKNTAAILPKPWSARRRVTLPANDEPERAGTREAVQLQKSRRADNGSCSHCAGIGGKPRRLCAPVGQRPDGDEDCNQDPYIFCHGEAARWSPTRTKAALRSAFLAVARRSALDEQEIDCLFLVYSLDVWPENFYS